MPWSNATNPKYRSIEHRQLRVNLMAKLKRDGYGICAEPVCVMRSRRIEPWMKLHLSHTDDGLSYLGLSHSACNVAAAARKSNRLRRPVRRSNVW